MALSKSFIRDAATTPLDARLMNMAQIVCNADGTPRPGVIGNPGANLVSTTATMNVTVAAAEFATTKGKADGVAIFTNDGTVNVAIGAAPASNSRIDVIWVKHNDNTTGDANALPVFGVTAGTAAASPTKPAIPTGALELATLRIYAGTTATNGGSNTLTNTYQMTASRGGVVPFRTPADLTAWTTPQEGQLAYDISTGDLYRDTPAGWKIDSTKIVPTAVSGTGTSLVNGDVVLTNATGTFNIAIPFSTRFDHYLVEMECDTVSGDAGVSFQLRAAGSAIATNYYGTYEELALGLGRSKNDVNNGTSFPYGRIATQGGSCKLDIYRPMKTVGAKLFECKSIDGATYRREAAGYCSASNTLALDGVVITIGGVTISTGRIRVIGIA